MRALVGIAQHDELDEVPQAEATGDELLGEEVQGGGVPQLVVVGEVVEGLNKAMTDQFGPHAVHEGAGEVAVARAGDEVGELIAQDAGAVNVAENIQFPALGPGFLKDLGFEKPSFLPDFGSGDDKPAVQVEDVEPAPLGPANAVAGAVFVSLVAWSFGFAPGELGNPADTQLIELLVTQPVPRPAAAAAAAAGGRQSPQALWLENGRLAVSDVLGQLRLF